MADEAISLTQSTVTNWLCENSEEIAATFRSEATFLPVVGGSVVEGLMTRGSDLDFCMLMDAQGGKEEAGKLQLTFKHSMSRLHDRLRQLGLRGLCRISRRIRDADEFLELHRCHESNAAAMRTGVKLNYILSCSLLDMETDEDRLGTRLATQQALLDLKRRLYNSYCRTVGYSLIPMLPYLLRRPGSYTPRRVITQVQIVVNNVLLLTYGINGIAGTLDAKISRVVDTIESDRASAERAVIKDSMNAAICLIRNLKCRASTDRNLHEKSFHHLILKSYLEEERWPMHKKVHRLLS